MRRSTVIYVAFFVPMVLMVSSAFAQSETGAIGRRGLQSVGSSLVWSSQELV
jgi:hypothetical protein